MYACKLISTVNRPTHITGNTVTVIDNIYTIKKTANFIVLFVMIIYYLPIFCALKRVNWMQISACHVFFVLLIEKYW